MAKLTSFLLSLQSQTAPIAGGETVPQLICPLIVIKPKFIPSEYSFAITIGITDIDLTVENVLRMVFKAPSGDIVFDTGDGTLPPSTKETTLPRSAQGFIITLPLMNISISEEGTFLLDIIWNGECLDTHDIPVYKQEERK